MGSSRMGPFRLTEAQARALLALATGPKRARDFHTRMTCAALCWKGLADEVGPSQPFTYKITPKGKKEAEKWPKT